MRNQHSVWSVIIALVCYDADEGEPRYTSLSIWRSGSNNPAMLRILTKFFHGNFKNSIVSTAIFTTVKASDFPPYPQLFIFILNLKLIKTFSLFFFIFYILILVIFLLILLCACVIFIILYLFYILFIFIILNIYYF